VKEESFPKYARLLICLLFLLQCPLALGAQGEDFPVGSELPPLALPAPDSPDAREYLGLKTMGQFKLSDIDSKIVLIEFMSAMCPVCHATAPLVNKLYRVIEGDSGLAKNVKIIGIAVGNNYRQLDAYKKNFKVPFPILPDDGYAVTGPMGGVDTPTMIVATKSGKVLSSHRGVIEDFDGYLKELREIVKKQ
jgi:thiol-disulfide isomerase/thioredoxin